MRAVFLALFVCLVVNVQARTFYFSSSVGDDNRSSDQAQSSSTPWRSIQKLNSIFSLLAPGDQVLFKKGDVFTGSIQVTRSGASGAPILFGAYGDGAKPVI